MSSNEIKTYRIYFFNAQKRITDTAVVDCSEDRAALERALEMLQAQRDYRAVEIWQENRKVGHYDRQTAIQSGGGATDGPGLKE